MAELFNRETIDPEVPGFILCSHGPMAMGMVETIRMLTGEQKNISAFTLEEGDSVEEYQEKLGNAIEAYPAGCIVFVDVLGGTPSNSVMLYARQVNRVINSVAGLNVPMMMEAVLTRPYSTCEELMNTIMQIENGGVVSITEKLQRLIK